jgi:hypothetical protein
VVTLTGELEMDALVHDPLALQARADTGVAQQVDRPLLEHAGADAVLDVVAAPTLEDDAVDPGELEQPRERQACRAGADDPDLRSQTPSSSSTRWKT